MFYKLAKQQCAVGFVGKVVQVTEEVNKKKT